METYKSRVYTDRPDYADYPAPKKFQTIQAIIAKHLTEHPNAICSYSGGADSDIMIDLIERTRKLFNLPPIKYAFFNTGLEMQATKDHVKATAEKYGVEIRVSPESEHHTGYAPARRAVCVEDHVRGAVGVAEDGRTALNRGRICRR